jgi:hypothetical protein
MKGFLKGTQFQYLPPGIGEEKKEPNKMDGFGMFQK